MKKILLFASALAGLFLAGSCQKETLEPAAQGGVTYEITLPDGPQTKGENGYKTYDLHYEVYKTADHTKLATTPLLFEKTVTMNGNTTTVTLDLLNDQDYTVLFWANKQGENYFDLTDLRQVGVRQAASNNEDRDAFCGMDQLEQHDGAQSKSVELKRPFAQINIATLVPTVAEIGYDVTPLSSRVLVKKIPVKYNVFTGEPVDDAVVDVDYTVNLIPEGNLTVNTTEYKKVAMNYALVPATQDNSATVEVYYEINTVNGTVKNSIPNVPVKKNYRTNIIGNLLTSNATYTIEVKPGFEEGDLAPHPIYLAAANGGEVTLTEDLDLGGKTLEIKGDMSLNLDGYTVTGVMTVEEGADVTIENGKIVNADKAVSGITTNGNLTLNDVEIESARHAVRVESGKVVINGGTYKVAPVSNSTLHALNVGDNGTEAEVIIKGGIFIGPKGTMADSGSAVNVRSGSKVTIEGGDFSGGKNKTLACGGTLTVKGGSFDQDPAAFVAEGYKAVSINGKFHVLPEVVADAATNANVTALTESTAAVATALATDNGEATMFMWNDVAYIAKYGEVIIASSADEATTVRGVVEGATGLKKATVAEGIEVVGNRTFRRCANLETVEFPSTLTEIGTGVFQSCSKLANVTIPASVTTIGEGAFAECTSLTSINIPGGITRIEQNTFNFSGIQSIEFHEGVTYFGAQAFRDCKQLKEVVIKAPEFTVEANAFGVMSGALPGTTIYVANAEMKAYLESTLAYKNQFTIVAPNSASTAEELAEAFANGENVVMTQDITTEAATTAPYGNKYAFKLDGGVLDGNGHELHMECYGDDYGIMTSGGTIKNLTIKEGCRAVMIMYPQQDVILDNVNIGGDGVLYPINTGEAGAEGVNLVVTNSVLAGWTSFSLIESASFTNVEFKQGTYYNNIYGRVLKPYVNTTLTNCAFVEHMNLDLSSLTAGHKVIMTNCTVNGQAVTADVFTVPTTDSQYDTELFTIDLPSWASSINDCVVFN